MTTPPDKPQAIRRRTVRPVPYRKASDEELTQASTFTADDLAAIRERWRQVASPKFKALLDAKPVGEDANTRKQ